MKRDYVDFHAIPAAQLAMHERLLNWARSCFGGYGNSASPMFRWYRSTEVWIAPAPSIPVDEHDASKIAKGVHALPEKHMRALNWYYVSTGSPLKARKAIGCTFDGLAAFVIDGRQMLINRRI